MLKTKRLRWIIPIILVALLSIGLTLAVYAHTPTDQSPVPANIRARVSFPIYYPDPKRLPAGYRLDKNSFRLSDQAVIYVVTDQSGRRLVFSAQASISDNELATFTKRYVPIHRQLTTPVGLATVGAIDNQTVISLPTNDGTWIIVTGPSSLYSDDQLKALLQDLRK